VTADFFKYQGLGNVYLVVDPQKSNLQPTGDGSRLLCDWHYGIGGDGVLYGPILVDGLPGMRIFNPDGSEAEKSGNGIRIFARYLYEQKYLSETRFRIATLGGVVEVELLDAQAGLIRVDMGEYTFLSSQIPAAGPERQMVDERLEAGGKLWRICGVSIGNPHCVAFCGEISKQLALEYGPLVENHSLFPRRTNVQFARIIDRQNIEIEIWERGAGYTLASGSSSCAAAAAAHRLGMVDNQVQVRMPGGILDIFLNDNRAMLTGPVVKIAEGQFSQELWNILRNRTQLEEPEGCG
jgi:diaminopimelate epimerase